MVSVSFFLLCRWSPVETQFSVACALSDCPPWVVWCLVSVPSVLEAMKTEAQVDLGVSKALMAIARVTAQFISDFLFSLNLGALYVSYFIASSSMHLSLPQKCYIQDFYMFSVGELVRILDSLKEMEVFI